MGYTIVSAEEKGSYIAINMVIIKVNEYIKKGYIPIGNLSVTYDKYNLCCVSQAMIKED